MCEIAIADEVEIVISAQVGEEWLISDSCGLADVVARAADVPQLVIRILPSDVVPTVSAGRTVHSIDLDDLDDAAAIDVVARGLSEHRHMADTALEVCGNVAAFRTICTDEANSFDDRASHVVFITDAPGMGAHLAAAGRRGLGVAVGGMDPLAPMRVDHAVGAVSIIDALVALRAFAFGGEHECEDLAAGAIDVRRRCGQAELSAIAR
ncbi:MAG: hypothetical protein WEB78_07310 [Ilumatobacteraceae bacterium]